MGKINVMSENLANKIAAGEVVERIANVVKELVENSIDAGSKNIKIELIAAGSKSIKIIDDGCGMSRDDATLCFERHATSKIKTENDLYFIGTLGFRGEALAAIASVSNIVLDTYDGNEATLVEINGGKIEKVCTGSMRQGTIIEVKELFYNTPARLKFMKSLTSELSLTTEYIEKIALSHSDISFLLINDEKEVVKTSGSGDLYKTIHEIFGLQTTKNMIKIDGENYDYTISGYISNLNLSRSSKKNMITLVNGRVVSNNQVYRAIKDAYHRVLADNKYPIVVINIETDPTLIDVNIHPTKQDIKFSKMESLIDLMFNTIREKLNNSNNTFKPYGEGNLNNTIYENNSYKFSSIKEDTNDYELNDKLYEEKHIEEVRLVFDDEKEEIKYDEAENERKTNLIKPVGLALGTFIIAEDEDTMYMFDIHAADERYNYERIVHEMKEKKIYKTNMLFPLTLEYPKNEYMKIKTHLDDIISLGIDVEDFGKNTFKISAHPSWIKEGYEDECIKKIFEIIIEEKDKFDRVKFNDAVAASVACKSSVKANTRVSFEEMERIIKNLFTCEFPFTCPHGRPTHIKYPLYELEKMFKRVNFSKVNDEV